MKQGIYCIVDSVAGTASPPYMLPNNRTAIRGFANMVNDPNSRVAANPGDFSLFYLGEYDDETAVLVVEPSKVFLFNGASLFGAKISQPENNEVSK